MGTTPTCKCFDQDCSTCYNYSVAYCPSNSILIPTSNLINHTTYYQWIRDKFDNIYVAQFHIAPFGGKFYITKSNFPEGMFTPEFGPITIFLSTDSDGLNIQPMKFGSVFYNCLIFSVDKPVYLNTDDDCDYLTDDDDNLPLIAQ